MKCARCESVGREHPHTGKHKVVGVNSILTLVCDECLKEIEEEEYIYYYKPLGFEIENDEEIS